MTDHLKELERFCQQQISRLLLDLEIERESVVQLPTKIQTVPAVRVSHAAGRRKPSLSQQEMEE